MYGFQKKDNPLIFRNDGKLIGSSQNFYDFIEQNFNIDTKEFDDSQRNEKVPLFSKDKPGNLRAPKKPRTKNFERLTNHHGKNKLEILAEFPSGGIVAGPGSHFFGA